MNAIRSSTRSRKNTDIAFIVVMLAAYAVFFANLGFAQQLADMILVIGLGLVYLLVGLFGSRVVERYQLPAITVLFFAFQIPLGSWINYLSHGTTWLLLLPMVGTAVELLPRPWVILTCAAILVGQMFTFYMLFDLTTTFAWGISMLAAIVFVAVFTQIMVSEQKARADLAQANQKLREYAAQVEELAIVKERNRLAREIHDGLGHYLTAINIQIKAAQAVAGQDPSLTHTALNKAQTLTQEALSDIRRSISSLRADPTTNRPLPETINRLLADARATDVQARLTVSGVPRPLSPQVEFTLYRVVQEGLTNVRKHAQASQVELNLEYLDHSICLVIQDNGVGSEQMGSGFGLMGLRERVEMLGGALKLDSTPGKGFTLRVDIPI